jgi:hypothetical protein
MDYKGQNVKYNSSICFNCDSHSDEINCSLEWLKHEVHRISTELGMQINYNEQPLKHNSSIRFNFDSDSNEIGCSCKHVKHEFPRISTELGIQMDCNEHLLNNSLQFVSILT